jgi:hypothetical protein
MEKKSPFWAQPGIPSPAGKRETANELGSNDNLSLGVSMGQTI